MSDGERAARPPEGPSDGMGRGDLPPLLGAVLAGGKSSRMGVDKATLPHPQSDCRGSNSQWGRSYLDHAIARLAPLVERIVVSGRDWPVSAADRERTANVVGLQDATADLGPAMGVATALRYAAAHGLGGVLVTPVDMPDLRTEQLAMLLRAWSQSRGIVCASFSPGAAEPLLAIYPLSALPAVEQVVLSSRRSLSRWLSAEPVELVRLPDAVCKNVNRPEDR